MPRFHIQDIRTIETTPTSPAHLRAKVGEMILNSTIARAKVEALNPETGEYKVVLQGTLDKEDIKWEEK
jgi:hypothetical protein